MTDVTLSAHDAKRMAEEFRALADDPQARIAQYDDISRKILYDWADHWESMWKARGPLIECPRWGQE